MTAPKILFFDIESAGVNALKSDLGFVIIFGYKWAHEKKAKAIRIAKKDLKKFDDRPLLIKASKIFEQADLVVAHFGSVFDRRFIQGRLLINGLPPIPNTKMRDTCMISRSVANFSSNRLKHLCKILNLTHQKLENNWPSAWLKVMQGNARVLSVLTEYCKGDCLALEELYFYLQPFDNPHPRMIMDRSKCGVCGNDIEYRGYSYKGQHRYRRYQCKSCRKWGMETRRAA